MLFVYFDDAIGEWCNLGLGGDDLDDVLPFYCGLVALVELHRIVFGYTKGRKGAVPMM
jgi:hypothetical protein